MCCKGFIKRIVPFFLTFAVSLFIASFFVSIAAPNFRFNFERRRTHREYDLQREIEIQRLNERNALLERKLADSDSQDSSTPDLKYLVPPPPPMPPAPGIRYPTVPFRDR